MKLTSKKIEVGIREIKSEFTRVMIDDIKSLSDIEIIENMLISSMRANRRKEIINNIFKK